VTAPRGSGTDDRGAAWRKPAFLLLAVIPVALVVPIVAARPWLGLPVLTLGMLAGLGFMTVGGEPDDRTVEAPLPEEPVEASLEPVEQVPAWAPSRGHDPFGRNPDRVAAEHPAAPHRPYPFDDHRRHDRSSGPPLGTLPPRQALAPPRASVDPGAADPGAADRVADAPPVLDGGTAAGRSPWRLPDVQGHPGIAADAARVGDLEVRAASIIGPSHRCESPASPRQDAYALALTPSQSHLVVAVADGVSSSRHSDLGARVAASAAVRILTQCVQGDPELLRLSTTRLFQEIAGEMVGTARSRHVDERHICSLLVVAVIPTAPSPDGRRRVWTAQVGDVSLWLLGPGGWSQHTGVEKQGLDRNTVSAVLPFAVDQAVAGVIDVPGGHVVAVMTDGLGDVLTNVAGAQQFYSRRWARPPHPTRFVGDLCVDAKGQTDDRTAVAVWCGPSVTDAEETR